MYAMENKAESMQDIDIVVVVTAVVLPNGKVVVLSFSEVAYNPTFPTFLTIRIWTTIIVMQDLLQGKQTWGASTILAHRI